MFQVLDVPGRGAAHLDARLLEKSIQAHIDDTHDSPPAINAVDRVDCINIVWPHLSTNRCVNPQRALLRASRRGALHELCHISLKMNEETIETKSWLE